MIPGIQGSGYRANTVVPGSTAASVTRLATGTTYTEPGNNISYGQYLHYGNNEYVLCGQGTIQMRKSLSDAWITIPKPATHLAESALYAEIGGVKYWAVTGPTASNGGTYQVSYVVITNSLSEVTNAAQWSTSANIVTGNTNQNTAGFIYTPSSTTTPFAVILTKGNFFYATSITGPWTVAATQWGNATFVRFIPIYASTGGGVISNRIVIGSSNSATSIWHANSSNDLLSAGGILGSGSPIGSSAPIDVIHYNTTWLVICNSNIGMYSTSGEFRNVGSWTATTIFPATYTGRSLVQRNGNVIASSAVATSDKYLCRNSMSTLGSAWTQSSVSTTTEGSRRGIHNEHTPHVWSTATGALEYSW